VRCSPIKLKGMRDSVPPHRTQLSAGGRDVLALALSDKRRHVSIQKDLLEGHDQRLLRLLEFSALIGVEGDEVYL